MKNLLGANLASVKEVKESEIIYVTENLTSDLELMKTNLDKTIVLGNILNYSKVLGLKDTSKLKEVLNKYKEVPVEDFKKDANELLSFIKEKYNMLESDVERLKERFFNILSNPAIIDIIVHKDKLRSFFERHYDSEASTAILNILDSIPTIDGNVDAYKDIYQKILKEMMENFKELEDVMADINDKYLDLLEEMIDNASEYLKKVNKKESEKKEDSKKSEKKEEVKDSEEKKEEVKEETKQEKALFRPVIDIDKLNKASQEMSANMEEHIKEMTIDTEESDKEVKEYTCNHCKDPECKRKPGELSALCIHANDNINKKGNK